MSASVDVAVLRENLERYLARAERGERVLVTDGNRPVAELGPVAPADVEVGRGKPTRRASLPTRRGLPEPLTLDGDPYAMTRALERARGYR